MTTRKIDLIKNETRDVKWVVDNLRAGLLRVDNSFQRKYVWLKKHQIRLIETILLGYSIPEIYLWTIETDPDSGETIYSIVDGQQRLGAVQNFILGKFKLDSRSLDSENQSYSNKKFTDLTPEQKNAIWEYPFSVRFIKKEMNREDIVEMFLRLNSTNMNLNPQELRNADFDGLFLQLAAEIAQHPFWEKHKVFSPNQIRRMLDVQFVSTILIFFRMGIEGDTTQASINKVYDLYNEVYDEQSDDRNLFNAILQEIEKLMVNPELERFVGKETHLYILMIIVYIMLQKGLYVQDALVSKLEAFVSVYDGDIHEIEEKYGRETAVEMIEYRQYSSEGTQTKSKRVRRLEIMRKVLGV